MNGKKIMERVVAVDYMLPSDKYKSAVAKDTEGNADVLDNMEDGWDAEKEEEEQPRVFLKGRGGLDEEEEEDEDEDEEREEGEEDDEEDENEEEEEEVRRSIRDYIEPPTQSQFH
jgi:hypothetical protein